jgi:putative ABC transport system permease protein
MTPLNQKLVRDLLGMKTQAAAISVVIAAGVATFVMSLSTLASLSRSKDAYYDRYRFAHVFTHLKRAPNDLAVRIASIPGVGQVQTRIVFDVTIDVAGMPEPAVGRLISIPPRQRATLNDIHLRRGRYIDPVRDGEVLVSEAFAEAHHFVEGDTVTAIINGRRQTLEIVGIVLSPEYIIQLQGGTLLPDERRFGVFWMSYDQLAAAFNMEGAFNDMSVSLMRGTSEAEVMLRLDELTETYGASGAYDRHDQVSHHYITEEIRQLRSMGIIAPTIFLSVAAFLLNVVLSRVIATQREQIAALKAFGYRKSEIRNHYLKFVLVITVIGVLLGTLVGSWMGRNLTELYTQFYRFPVSDYHLSPGIVSAVLLISVAAAVLSTTTALRRAVDLPPAEAMRPEPPGDYRPTILERSGAGFMLPQTARMILRQLERRPFKSCLTSFGIATAVAVLILGSFTEDALDYMISFQFYLAQRHDLSVSFVEAESGAALHEMQQLPGVMYCEPFRSVPTRFRFEHHSRRVGLMGLEPDATLFQLLDEQERHVPLPLDGLMLSSKLAEVLHVGIGDVITIEVLEGNRPVRHMPVTALITEFAGTNAYMDLNALWRMLREDSSLSGAFLDVDDKYRDQLYAALKTTPQVAAVNIKSAALKSFEETIGENIGRMRLFNVIFASIIAVGVVYNSARISLSERSREMATLRVIGFTRAEISAILLGELAILTLAAIPVGLTLGYGFAAFATLGLDTELYRIPLVVDRSTYGFAVAVIIIATALAGLVVRRKLDHLDLVAVLKSRE